MAEVIDLRLSVGIPAAVCQKYSLIMKANIIHNLLKCPEKLSAAVIDPDFLIGQPTLPIPCGLRSA